MLASVQEFGEVIIYDNGSKDLTLQIAEKFPNVKVFQGPFQGFGKTHNLTSALATHDWILSIDSDEVLTPGLIEEIKALCLQEDCIYSVARKNYYNGKWIRGCGWYPDRQVKLYHRKKTCFNEKLVHESIVQNGLKIQKLKVPLNHFSYENTSHFLEKMDRYSDLFAREHAGKKESSIFKAIWHALFAFFKTYILKYGFIDGKEGFIIALYNANTAFYKYVKLFEANEQWLPSDPE